MYFDEIYHGRTGYEQLHKMPVYETTHPPLGKDLIMVGIAMFGMTGFGWRFSGTLFGVLLVPLAWCFVRRLTRKPWVAAVSGVLLALDFMRFPKAAWQRLTSTARFHPAGGVLHAVVLPAGADGRRGQRPSADGAGRAGLRPGLRGQVDRHLRRGRAGGALPGRSVRPLAAEAARLLGRVPHGGGGRRTVLCAAAALHLHCVLPAVLVAQPSFSLGDWWQCQVSMYSYHSTLQATHPFESRWYTWLLGLRPVWYYRNGYLPYGIKASIVGMAGPVIWLAGLAALVGLLWRQVSGAAAARARVC